MMDYNTMLKAHQEIEVAKERIVSGDYIAARRKLLEVQRHLPAFDDISRMIAVCDILFSAGLGFSGCGTDCYWVLQLSPEASESDMEYQYNKFIDLLKPIKNNFPGAASALKIIQDAFLVLADPEKRSMFDKKRAARLETYGSRHSQETHAVNSQQFYLLAESLVQKEENSLIPTRCKRTACETLDGNNDASCSIQILSTNDSAFKLSHAISPLLPSDAASKPLKLKWSGKEFASDQIWAVYDGPDSMPRRYVVVNNVVSWSEVCITYLEPQPVLDDEIYWVEENLPLVCGLFRAGETTLNLGLSRFSHIVKCEQTQQSTDKSLYMIYPKTGEIWAMYRDWNSRRKPVDITSYQYQIVKIVTGFSEDSVLIAASLTEVPGYKSFFQRLMCNEFELIRTVPRTEMLSFSHQIPAFTVPGSEIHGIPEGSWHLEPDALPPNCSPTS